MISTDLHEDAASFAEILRGVKLPDSICVDELSLPIKKGVSNKIRYNQSDIDSLGNSHEYTILMPEGELQVSLQLYQNDSGHYRLFCYTKFGKVEGMVFSLNLTTAKESNNIISLVQKIKFIERHEGNKQVATEYRKKKQVDFCDLLIGLGFDVSKTNDVTLGAYDTLSNTLIGTTAQKLLNDFLIVSILKGHFQGNKGYQVEINA